MILKNFSFYMSKIVVNHSCLLILLTNFFGFFTISFILGTKQFKLNNISNRDYLVWSDEKVKRMDGLNIAKNLFSESNGKLDNGLIAERSQIQSIFTTFILYKSKTGENIFNVKNVNDFKNAEKIFMEMNQGE